jgi:anti-sigma factor RsiW
MDECAEIGESTLSAFFDGELDGPAARAVAAHLETCGDCRAALGSLARLEEPLAAEEVEAPPVAREEWSARWDAIRSALAEKDDGDLDEVVLAAAERAARLVRRLIPVAAAALILLVTWGVVIERAHEAAHRAGPGFVAEATFGGFGGD